MDSALRVKFLAYSAALCGVTPARFLAVVKARKAYVAARMYRRRSRRRALEKNPQAKNRDVLLGKAVYSGAGELHELLSILGWTMTEFCDYAGIRQQTAITWRGHPMALWPVELLRLHAHNRAMAAKLTELGFDAASFSPKPLPKFPQGRYPRKRGDLKIDPKALTEFSPWK